MVMRANYENARDDRLRRAFAALLLAKAQGQIQLDRIRSQTEDDQRAMFGDLLQRGVDDGRLAPT
jgi:hypothetical protein